MGFFKKKKKTFTLQCPHCQAEWEIDKKTWLLTAYTLRGTVPAFTCPKCRCVGEKID